MGIKNGMLTLILPASTQHKGTLQPGLVDQILQCNTVPLVLSIGIKVKFLVS